MNKVIAFIKDNYKIGMTILNLFLLASMPFNPEFKMNHFTIFTLISRCIFPIIVLVWGGKGLWGFFFITTAVNVLDITFDDFTALSAIVILYLFIPDKKKWLKVVTVATYIIGVFIVATLHNKQPYHLFVHFIGCGYVVLTVGKLKAVKEKEIRERIETEIIKDKLELTNDERIILDELLKGKRQKEIEQFSPNTVCSKLREARERNGVRDNDELLERYRMF